MLTPVAQPKPPEASISALSAALAALAEDGAPVSRDAALGAFRRHLARIQQHVQHAFEQDQITGLQAARLLGKLTDGLISRCTSTPRRTPDLASRTICRWRAPAAMAAACWRRSATSTCCS